MATAQYYYLGVGQPPVITSLAWKKWFYKLVHLRIAECPSERALTYFYSTSGNNSNDGRDGFGFNLTNAVWDPSAKTLTSLGAFSSYTWQSGDQIYIKSGTDATTGLYEIESKVSSNAIKLVGTVSRVAVTNITTSNGPRQTLANANSLIFLTGSNVRFRFKRGDTWREATTFNITAAVHDITIDAYGDRALPKPNFSRFVQVSKAGATWVLDAGTTYKITGVGASTMGWVRYELDTTNLLRRQTSQANCQNNKGSWFHDGVNTLYVNPIDSWDMTGDSDTAIEYVLRNTLEGIAIADGAYGVRIENIRIDGYGCSPVVDQSYAGYGVHANTSGSGNVLCIGVESYFNNRHSIGLTSPSSGGIMTCIDCKYGACAEGSQIISYSATGSHEFVNVNGISVSGGLPTGQTPYAYGGLVGSFYSHCGSGKFSLLINYNETIVPGQHQAFAGFGVDGSNVPTWTDLKNARAFSVGEKFRTRSRSPFDATHPSTNNDVKFMNSWLPPYVVGVNCEYDIPILDDGGTHRDSDLCNTQTHGVYINSKFYSDTRSLTTGRWHSARAWVINHSGWTAQGFFNCHFHFFANPTSKIQMFHNAVENNTLGDYPDIVVMNCLISASDLGPGWLKLGFGNDGSKQKANAYCNVSGKTATYTGYSNDPLFLEVNHPWFGPPQFDTRAVRSAGQEALVLGYRLEYDINWNPRDPFHPVPGPWTYDMTFIPVVTDPSPVERGSERVESYQVLR